MLEELLEEAKRRYPVGTVVRCLMYSKDIVTIESTDFYFSDGVWTEKGTVGPNQALLYNSDKDRWATIISSPPSSSPTIQLYPL